MNRHEATDIYVEEHDVSRIWTHKLEGYDTAINIDFHEPVVSIYFTKAELQAMIEAIDSRDAQEDNPEIT
jgi:hypothetical protein